MGYDQELHGTTAFTDSATIEVGGLKKALLDSMSGADRIAAISHLREQIAVLLEVDPDNVYLSVHSPSEKVYYETLRTAYNDEIMVCRSRTDTECGSPKDSHYLRIPLEGGARKPDGRAFVGHLNVFATHDSELWKAWSELES